MYIGLSQPGAATRELAFAAADRKRSQTLRAVQPANPAVESRDKIRDKVLAELGIDRITLLKLAPQARIKAEISVMIETARRTPPAPIRATGNFVDLRV
ncbi:hypothetical protein [Phenylobacterium sp.]|jgi:hypothetical protein|uniref:hypothetical protein n=1 Tax=Phenylobacterium sp. TaxID=1871053 RepID=UPI0037C7AF43